MEAAMSKLREVSPTFDIMDGIQLTYAQVMSADSDELSALSDKLVEIYTTTGKLSDGGHRLLMLIEQIQSDEVSNDKPEAKTDE